MEKTHVPLRYELVGRELCIRWDDDGSWFDAIVVGYSLRYNRHRVIYTQSKEFETLCFESVTYRLYPKRHAKDGNVHIGRVLEFFHPRENVLIKAIVYEEPEGKADFAVVHMNQEKMLRIRGGDWEFLSYSPCILREPDAAPRRKMLCTAGHAQIADEDIGNCIRPAEEVKVENGQPHGKKRPRMMALHDCFP